MQHTGCLCMCMCLCSCFVQRIRLPVWIMVLASPRAVKAVIVAAWERMVRLRWPVSTACAHGRRTMGQFLSPHRRWTQEIVQAAPGIMVVMGESTGRSMTSV